MAGSDYDPLDIRSEMGYSEHVVPDSTTSPTTPAMPSSEIVPIIEQPVPLETILPGEPGNEIDIENLPDMDAVKKACPPPPQRVRRSKRQAGYNPDLTTSKRFRHKGEGPSRKSLADPENTSGDDSEDADYELVARKKTEPSKKDTPSSSENTESDAEAPPVPPPEPSKSTDEEITMAEFMATLKSHKATVSPITAAPLETKSSSTSVSDSCTASFVEKDDGSDDVSDENADAEADVMDNVSDTEDNTDLSDYDLDAQFNHKFYSEQGYGHWSLYANRKLLDERNADLNAFHRYNVSTFLKLHGVFSTVSAVVPFCRQPILEFYANLSSSIGDERSPKYGRVFVRNRLYTFNPRVINQHYNTPDVDDGPPPDVHEVTNVLTEGLVKFFPAHPDRLSAAKLTSLYSILHKVAIRNWTPSTNSTVVTRSQALTLYSIGHGTFNFGRLVFKTVLQFAEGGFKSSKLPFPSLIYGLLVSQGFVRDLNEPLSDVKELFKIASAFFKGNRKVDLPWCASKAAPAAATNAGQPLSTQPTEFVMLSTSVLQTQIDHALAKIVQAESDIAYYTNLVAENRLLLEVAVHSGQKGGVAVQTQSPDDAAGPSGTKKDED